MSGGSLDDWDLTGRAGILLADKDDDGIDLVANTLLDDILYNTIFDLCIDVHRAEKMARAETAAIRIEKLAADNADPSDNDPRPNVRVETDAAIYDDGKVYLKGNPLATTKDILCPRCHLPRLLAPAEGRGAQKPDPGTIYCKKHPYIDKPGYDIFGQTWVAQGPGRGKKKKDMEKKVDASVDGTVTPTPDGQRPPNVLSYPSATCSKCKRCILVTRLNNHMGSCIGNSGRNASRVASQKMKDGGNGSVNNDATPPASQKGTPVNGSRAGSPRKRDLDEVDEHQESDAAKPKKKAKKIKPPVLKISHKPKKDKDKVKTNSFLSVESKIDDEEDEDDKKSTVQVAPKKPLAKQPLPSKKLKVATGKPLLGSPKPKNSQADGGYESSDTLSEPPQAP